MHDLAVLVEYYMVGENIGKFAPTHLMKAVSRGQLEATLLAGLTGTLD
jgi:ribosomal protein S19